MSAFGAGGLGSYMGGGYDSPSQSSYAGNGQTILLLFVAAAVCMFLVGANIIGNSNSNETTTTEVSNNTGNNNGAGGSSNTSTTDIMSGLESLDFEGGESSQAIIDGGDIFASLSEIQAWISVGDNDLLLKALQNKTYEWGDGD